MISSTNKMPSVYGTQEGMIYPIMEYLKHGFPTCGRRSHRVGWGSRKALVELGSLRGTWYISRNITKTETANGREVAYISGFWERGRESKKISESLI